MRIFKNEEKLSPEYVPPRLPHRERELSLLETFFSSHITGQPAVSVRALIVGAVGTGKTALSKLFGSRLEKANSAIRYVHVNCKIHATLSSILKKAVEAVGAPIPVRGLSSEELGGRLMSLLDRKKMLLVIGLDEFDGFLHSDPQGIYTLLRLGEERSGETRISVIAITRNVEILEDMDESLRGMFQAGVMYLEEYSYRQLADIVEFRCSEAFYPGVMTEEAKGLVVDMASERGDARYAVELLWRGGKYAENEGAPRVTPEHIRKAAASIYPSVRREVLTYISRHEKLLLLAAARLLLSSERSRISSSELYQAYRVTCEELGSAPKAYTRFWEHMQRLEDLGLIRIKIESGGSRGRRSFVTLPGIPASIMVREISALLEASERE
ncbi:MAG: AAA family ATPase [Nitrososphaerota archaeon]